MCRALDQTADMAQTAAGHCSICLDSLKDAVTISCGHKYCLNCIQVYWSGPEKGYCCPDCKRRLERSVDEPSASGLRHVPCDVCSGRKLKASKSCLQCVASYCHQHLRPHQEVAALQRHQLVPPRANLQDNLCTTHNKLMEMFCSTDQQCICYLCFVEQHKGHELTSATEQMATEKKKLETRRQDIQQRIQAKELDLQALLQQKQSFGCYVTDTVLHSEESFTRLFRLLEDVRRRVTKQIGFLQQREELRLRELQTLLERQLSDLKTSCSELDSLLDLDDPCLFLHNCPAVVSKEYEKRGPTTVYTPSTSCFKEVTAQLSALSENLQLTVRAGLCKIPPQLNNKPHTREEFLKYWRGMTLDPNTANRKLSLSEENRRVTLRMDDQEYPWHPDRFNFWIQVLSAECCMGRSYWELEWAGTGGVLVAVTYKNIQREGPSSKCQLGHNDSSWALECSPDRYRHLFFGDSACISGPVSSRIGVYLDQAAGLLSFYSVSQSISLLYQVQTRFTQPLYVGLRLWYPAATAAFINPNQKNNSVTQC